MSEFTSKRRRRNDGSATLAWMGTERCGTSAGLYGGLEIVTNTKTFSTYDGPNST